VGEINIGPCNCCTVPCLGCLDWDTLGIMTVEISGISAGFCSPDCTDVNGIFELPIQSPPFTSGQCSWRLDPEISCLNFILLRIEEISSSSYMVAVTLVKSTPTAWQADYRLFVDDPIECLSLNELDVPLDSSSGSGCFASSSFPAKVTSGAVP
jgi:hypothetical protein